MIAEAKKSAQDKMEKSLASLANELKKIRTGRAQISMLDNVKVNYYGNLTPLNQVSAISTPDAKSFLISPWEASILKEIEAAIIKSDIGMSPINDGKVIRLKVPDLTEERRKETVKKVKGEAEHAKVAIRNIRKDANEAVKKLQKEGLAEDEAKGAETQIQKTTDNYIKKIDDITAAKEAELMHV